MEAEVTRVQVKKGERVVYAQRKLLHQCEKQQDNVLACNIHHKKWQGEVTVSVRLASCSFSRGSLRDFCGQVGICFLDFFAGGKIFLRAGSEVTIPLIGSD